MSCADLTHFALHIVYPWMFTTGIATTHTQPINVCKYMFTHLSIWFFHDSFKSLVPSPVSYCNSDHIFSILISLYIAEFIFYICWTGSSDIDNRTKKWGILLIFFFCNNNLRFNLNFIYFMGFLNCCWHCFLLKLMVFVSLLGFKPRGQLNTMQPLAHCPHSGMEERIGRVKWKNS